MSRRLVGRYLNRARLFGRDLLFRSIVVGTLIIVAAIFATRPFHKTPQEQGSPTNTNQKTPDKIESNGFLSVGADAWTAIFTGVLTIFTGLLVTTGYVQIRYLVRADETARKSAEAAKQSADVARDTLVASQRAWLKVRVIIGNQPLIITDTQATLSIKVAAENIGNAPALNVTFHVNMIAWRNGPVYDEHNALCDRARKAVPFSGSVIFPGDSLPTDGIEYLDHMVIVHGKEFEDGLNSGAVDGEGRPILMLFISGCVTYSVAADKDYRHMTRFLFQVNSAGIFAGQPFFNTFHPRKDPIPSHLLNLSNFVLAERISAD